MVRHENDETTIVDDPVASAGAADWPDTLGLCAGVLHHWIHRLEVLRQRGELPPDIAHGVDQALAGCFRPAAEALIRMAETQSWDATPDA